MIEFAWLLLPVGVFAVLMMFKPKRQRYWRDNEEEEGYSYTEPHNLRT